MQSLLSPSENSAFQSFLSVMDYPDDALTSTEWAKLTAGSSLSSSSQDTLLVDTVPEPKETLAKAAKDLMSLETDRWRSQSMTMQPAADAHGRSFIAPQDRFYELQRQELQHEFHQQRQHQVPNASFLFPQGKVQEYLVRHPNPVNDGAQLSPTIQQHAATATSQRSIRSSHHRSSSDSLQLSLETSHSSSSSTLQPSLTPNASQALFPHRTTRQSSSSSSSKRSRASTSSSSTTPTVTSAPKQNLLSPSQKKANHIQSEQKRRANIRRGYEALCETVPALREAIRLEEDEAAMMAERDGASTRRKRKRSAHGKDGIGGDKEKIDGRAGPRSENVVLMRTIEHIQDLLSERSALFARLHEARSFLPPGHPVLTPLHADPMWEREWKGGEGRIPGADGDDDGASGSEGEVDEGED